MHIHLSIYVSSFGVLCPFFFREYYYEDCFSLDLVSLLCSPLLLARELAEMLKSFLAPRIVPS